MTEKHVIFVMANPPDQDIRISKEASTLKQAGYVTELLYWDRSCKSKGLKDTEEYYNEKICLRLKAPSGTMLIPLFPIWWSFVLVNLLVRKWDIVHALNLHTIIPALMAGKLKGNPVIYEILDVYEAILPRVLRTICMVVDKFFMRFADSVIVADEMQVEGMGGIPNHNIVPIYDSPPDTLSQKDTGYLGNQMKENFMLFYAGVLDRKRRLNLDKVIEAITEIEGVKLMIAGYGDLTEGIRKLSSQMPDKIEFIGKISYEEVISRGIKADLFFVLRDPLMPTHRYTCGSTLFNAMICSKPILVNQGTSTTRKVSEENCGLVVNSNSIEEIRRAITKLKEDRQLYQELAGNARKAYEQRYSWQIMERRLVALYRELAPLSGRAEDSAATSEPTKRG